MGNLEDILLPSGTEATDSWFWAVVHSVNPLRVRKDGETNPISITPLSVGGTYMVGDRVRCHLSRNQLIIIGSAGHGGTPRYAGSRGRPFDAKDGLYNQTGTSMFTGRLKMTMTKRGRSTTLLILGSSTVAGFDSPGNDAWPSLLLGEMERDGFPIKGDGVIFLGAAKAASDPRWTYSGTVTQASLGLYATITNASWAQYQVQRTCNTCTISYYHTGGNFSMSVNGGAAINVTTNGSSTQGQYTLVGLTGTPTIRITATSATPAEIASINPNNSAITGLTIASAGVGGTASGNWTSNNFKDNLWAARNANIPGMTVISIGGNDCTLGVPIATFKSNLKTIINWSTLGGSGSALVAMPHANTPTIEQWWPYVAAMYDVADEMDVPLLDMTYRWHNLTEATNLGMFANLVHPNSKGHADYAHAAKKLLV